MLRRYCDSLWLFLLLLAFCVQSANATCPYDLETATQLIPPACYANASSADALPATKCCWHAFAANIFAATRYANFSGAAFLPQDVASACYTTYSETLLIRGLFRPSLLSDGSCDLTSSSFAYDGGPCQFPTVDGIQAAVNLSEAILLCASPTADPDPAGNSSSSCPSCQNAVLSATISLLKAFGNNESFVTCGKAATLGLWSPFFPSIPKYRTFALCMIQFLEQIGTVGIGGLFGAAAPPPGPGMTAPPTDWIPVPVFVIDTTLQMKVTISFLPL